ncbi:serine hydrolase domain-containing protein [Plantibacter sp. YIM 135249]|jgi:D-alanyl-D-alanine carboxypeptidase|uniref:serine hydrolase domain-containing protein n=1 Tax=Plantibacter sp. YIM 135249 TaxID=3423918 RepID=UPI003D334BD3
MTENVSRGRRIGALITAVTLAVALAACSGPTVSATNFPKQVEGELPKDVRTSITAAVESAVTQSGSSGAVVGVWAPWAGSMVAGVGTTEPGGSTKMDPSMAYRIGDTTRPMTCTVLLQLVDEGKVKLDQKVNDVVPQVQGIDGITFGQLCQNTSGLGSYSTTLQGQFIANPTRNWSMAEILANGLASGTRTAPGALFGSSDTGYILLGMAIQQLTGQSWQSLYQEYLFSPLGMKQSALPDATTTVLPGTSHPHGYTTTRLPDGTYQCDTPVDESELSPSMAWTAGGVVSSVDDLRAFTQSLASGSLLTKSTYKKQWANPVPIGPDAPTWQSFGIGAMQLGPMRGQAGSIPGYLSAAFSDPTSGLTVVVMLNNSTVGAGFAKELAMQLASIGSKAAPASGQKKPDVQLPWSEQQAAEALAASAMVCAPPAAPAEPEAPAAG